MSYYTADQMREYAEAVRRECSEYCIAVGRSFGVQAGMEGEVYGARHCGESLKVSLTLPPLPEPVDAELGAEEKSLFFDRLKRVRFDGRCVENTLSRKVKAAEEKNQEGVRVRLDIAYAILSMCAFVKTWEVLPLALIQSPEALARAEREKESADA